MGVVGGSFPHAGGDPAGRKSKWTAELRYLQ